jgi:hypothetical protein
MGKSGNGHKPGDGCERCTAILRAGVTVCGLCGWAVGDAYPPVTEVLAPPDEANRADEGDVTDSGADSGATPAEIKEPAEAADDADAASVPEEPAVVTAQLDALSDMDDAHAGVLVENVDVPAGLVMAPAEPQLPVVSGETAVSVEEVLDPLTAPLEALTAHGVKLVALPAGE